MKILLLLAMLVVPLGPQGTEPLQVVLVSGSNEYKSEPSLIALQEFLEKSYPIKCARAFGKDGGKDLPAIEALEKADVVVVFARRMTLPPDQLDRIKKFCSSSKGVMGIRTASHAFQNWLEFDKEVLGGDYKGHTGQVDAEVRLDEKGKAHPVLAGVQPFRSLNKIYKNPSPAADVTLLQTATGGGRTEPVTWVRERKEGRVFYTSLGVPEDFKNESFRRMLANAVFWTAKRDPPKTK
jgi:type 1 glutamine amidotransferase